MASQIYSRYIPPAKDLKDTTHHTPADTKPRLLSTQNDASASYARYVPPSKPPPRVISTTSITPIEAPPRTLLVSKRDREDPGCPASQPKAKRAKKPKLGDGGPPNDKALEHTPSDENAKLKMRKTNKSDRDDRAAEILRNPESSSEQHLHIPTEAKTEDARHKRLMGKREKSLKTAERRTKNAAKEPLPKLTVEALQEGPLQDLGPLPQPEPAPEAPTLDIPSSLPTWLASPIRVSPTTTAQFIDLGVPPGATDMLARKGFEEAFAVQAATLPLLLPGPAQEPGDVLVSAATGSGKTLAYVLPIIEELSRNTTTKLRALIVVPTRELVTQAQHVSEVCASAFAVGPRRRIKIGTALGNDNFKTEQSLLMDQELTFDPNAYRTELGRFNSRWDSSDEDNDGDDGDDEAILNKALPASILSAHVARLVSKVDLLICTPGRLVEHLKSTPGFSLQHVSWLVVDEADKLLDQSFQQWLDVVMPELLLDKRGPQCRSNHVRKVILSATLTTDIGELNALKLYRPKLVVLEGSSLKEGISKRQKDSQSHTLPSLLTEAAIKIDDEAIKPWYLLELLKRENMLASTDRLKLGHSVDVASDSLSTSGASNDEIQDGKSVAPHNSLEVIPKQYAVSISPRGVLVFTKSNETAVRLGRLIALLEPRYTSTLATLTSTTRSSTRRDALKGFESGKLSILIASDLVSRGLDLVDLAHVVNYDIPTSIASYVHRVGRTARAGKPGHAWTLFTGSEAWWFWNEIARSTAIEREPSTKISRVNISATQFDEEQRANYEGALEILKLEAAESKWRDPSSG